MVNAEELISQVHRRPAIWDKRLKLHGNRFHVDQCWREISAEMDVEDHLLKKKWKYLRDQYASELTKENRQRSEGGSEESVASKWQYFEPLSFLKQIVRPRRSSSKGSAVADVEKDEEVLPLLVSIEGNYEEEQIGETYKADYTRESANEELAESWTSEATDPEDQPETLQGQKIKELVNRLKRKTADEYKTSVKRICAKETSEVEDEHLLFFKTLLQHVKKIPPERIFPFRSKIHAVVQEFAYPQSEHGGS